VQYTFDHIEAQANGGDKVKSENLQWMTGRNNSSKSDRPEGPRASMGTVSLAEAKKQGQAAFEKAAQKMFGGKFSETEELDRLWKD
jgi:hypothetical protein